MKDQGIREQTSRDHGLQQAIRAVGGVSALARKLGVAQPSVSTWTRVPAERVLAVEAVSDVPRSVLRADLYPADDATPDLDPIDLDPIDEARARLYLLLANLMLSAPDEAMLADIGRIGGSDEGRLGEALRALADEARKGEAEAIARAFFALFVGVGRGEFLPYASYYLTGFLHEKPLARVRRDLARLGLERDPALSEPEDQIGFLLEIMAGLASRRIIAEPEEEKRFFDRHLSSWAEKFFEDLGQTPTSRFYAALGRVGREMIRIEREAFALMDELEPSGESAAQAEGAQG